MSSQGVQSFAVVPCAGRSVRMGRAKLLLPYGEGTVIEAVLAAWKASPVTRTVVVVRPDDPELADVCRRAGASVVVPEVAPPEMKHAVAEALKWINHTWQPASGDAWLLAPGDQPRLRPEIISQLLGHYNRRHPRVLVPVCHARRGHPIVLPWTLAAEVPRLAADEGINALVRCAGAVEVAVDDPAISEDLDTPGDYRRLLGG